MREAEPGVVRDPDMNSRSQMSTGSPKKFRTYPLPTSTQHMKISNKATALRELQRGQLAHVDKLRKMKPGIDMRSPKQYPHVQYNAKRMQVVVAASRLPPPPPSAPEACQERLSLRPTSLLPRQMEAERNLAIERENKILLGKMYSIMNAEPAYKTHKARPTQTMFTFMCAPCMFARLCSLPCSLSQVTVTSLNMNVRKQEYDRIARENQARTASRPSSSLGPPGPRPLPSPGRPLPGPGVL